jgi:hypothetical protein
MIGQHKYQKNITNILLIYYYNAMQYNDYIKKCIYINNVTNEKVKNPYFKNEIMWGNPKGHFRLIHIPNISICRGISPVLRHQISYLILFPENNESKINILYSQYIDTIPRIKITEDYFNKIMIFAYNNNFALIFNFRGSNNFIYYIGMTNINSKKII